MRRSGLILLATGAPLLLLALLVGGRWAEWLFVVVSLLFPAALCALGVARRARRRAAGLIVPLLGLLLVVSGAGILLLDGTGGSLLGLPAGTALMLVGLGLVPLIVTGLGYAADFSAQEPGPRPPGEREREAGR